MNGEHATIVLLDLILLLRVRVIILLLVRLLIALLLPLDRLLDLLLDLSLLMVAIRSSSFLLLMHSLHHFDSC